MGSRSWSLDWERREKKHGEKGKGDEKRTKERAKSD